MTTATISAGACVTNIFYADLTQGGLEAHRTCTLRLIFVSLALFLEIIQMEKIKTKNIENENTKGLQLYIIITKSIRFKVGSTISI